MALIVPAQHFLATPPPSLFFKGYTQIGDSEDSTRTFPNVAIGGPHRTRRVFAWVQANENDDGSDVVSATIGGIAADILKAGDPVLFTAVVPTGTTANIVVELNQEADDVELWTYVSYFQRSGTPTDSDSHHANKGQTASVSIDIAQSGFIMALATPQPLVAGELTLNNNSNTFDFLYSAQHLTAQTRLLTTASATSIFGTDLFAISFR